MKIIRNAQKPITTMNTFCSATIFVGSAFGLIIPW